MQDALPLERWTNFYLISATAAATLIGLLFVVITIAVDRVPAEAGRIRLYLTPTVVFLGTALALAAILTFPDHSPVSAAVCVWGLGGAGLVYVGAPIVQRTRWKAMYAHRLDALQYAVFPAVVYTVLIAGGAVVMRAPSRGLLVVAIAMLALITLAIRNSWAIAIEIASWPRKPGE